MQIYLLKSLIIRFRLQHEAIEDLHNVLTSELGNLKQETTDNLEKVLYEVNSATKNAKQDLNKTLEEITKSTEEEMEAFRVDSEKKSNLIQSRLAEVDDQITNIEKRNKSIDSVLSKLSENTNAQENATKNAVAKLEETVQKVISNKNVLIS